MSILLEKESTSTIPKQLQVFSTSPQSKDVPAQEYRNEVIKVARWSEDFGFTGILVYTDNALVDNWSVAQIILENTKHLSPLIAVQPIYMHPYMLAKRIATFAHIYGRKVYLNMLAGGFSNDLSQLGDNTPHDDRYARTVEYTQVIQGLLSSTTPFNFEGKFYQLKNVKMSPTVSPELMPGILISGSSQAAIQAAKDIKASLIRYPFPAEQETVRQEDIAPGFRVGIIARANSEEAWKVAHERFPEDRRGQIAHQLAAKVSDSVWHQELTEQAKYQPKEGTYWLGPFLNYQTFCPYLVGSYAEVAGEMRAYQRKGFSVYIVDIPTSFEELQHIQRVYSLI